MTMAPKYWSHCHIVILNWVNMTMWQDTHSIHKLPWHCTDSCVFIRASTMLCLKSGPLGRRPEKEHFISQWSKFDTNTLFSSSLIANPSINGKSPCLTSLAPIYLSETVRSSTNHQSSEYLILNEYFNTESEITFVNPCSCYFKIRETQHCGILCLVFWWPHMYLTVLSSDASHFVSYLFEEKHDD